MRNSTRTLLALPLLTLLSFIWCGRPNVQEVGRFSGGLAPVLVNGKWGFIDEDQRIVITPRFRDAEVFSEGLAMVRLQVDRETAKAGFIDAEGQMVINPHFDEAQGFQEGLALVQVNQKFGFIDKTGHIVIEMRFDGPNGFTEGLASAKIAMPLRNLKTPVLTTSSFSFKPSVIATRSPRDSPNLTNCCRIVSVSFPVFSSFFFSITKTELPNGAYEIAEPGTTSVLCFSGSSTSTFPNIPGRRT